VTRRFLELDEITVRYPGASTPAVDRLALEIDKGEVLALLGPSGCGKSTTLRVAAGLEEPVTGSVRLDGQDITSWTPERRRMGVVFQSYALFPHLNVAGNVGFGPKMRKASRSEVERAVKDALELVRLCDFAERPVDRLSGGQQQRVALARALASDPAVLLLDEPLSNLDAALREETRETLRTLLRGLAMTALFVTHDQADALAFADRIAVMRLGRLVEVGTPEQLYHEPQSTFTASFLGAANILDARMNGDVATIEGEGRAFDLEVGSRAGVGSEGEVALVLRPEAVHVAESAGNLRGTVLDRVFQGASTRLLVRLETGHEIRISTTNRSVPERVELRIRAEDVRALPRSGTGGE
jgi:putative spermidine/putrescine transport system ATP-binding protein